MSEQSTKQATIPMSPEVYIRLVYTSILHDEYNTFESIQRIIAVSQKNNGTYNIGGELTWYSNKSKILQILEGPCENVNYLLNIIKSDKRHTNIQIIAHDDITKNQVIYKKIWSAQIISPDSISGSKKKELTVNDFQLLSIIGSGGFSTVVKAINTIDKQNYAIKIMPKKKQTNNSYKIALTERDIWKNLNGSMFINRLHSCLQDPLNVYFVMDYAPRGDMFDLLKQYKLNEYDCLFYFSEILCGIKHIHDNGIIYRDVKLENILVDMDGHILLTDFGISDKSDQMDFKLHGTPMYFSPEIISNQLINQKNDIWALGIILYELTDSKVPWQGLSQKLMFQFILESQLTLDMSWSVGINNLLQIMTTPDYNERPDCDTVMSFMLDHNMINNWESVYNKVNTPNILPKIKAETTNRIIDFSI